MTTTSNKTDKRQDRFLPIFLAVIGVLERYPFGMELIGRTYKPDEYRYGFNNKEKDPEGMGGSGSTYDYGFRIYNPNIIRFLSVDPLTKSYPWYTPYQFAGNKPIWAIDLDGLEEKIVTQTFYDHGLGQTFVHIEKSEKLKKIWNSVNRADKVDKVRVYYGIMLPSERGQNTGGFTIDLKDAAKYVVYYYFNEREFNKLSEDGKATVEYCKNLFYTNNISRGEIMGIAYSEKEVYGVFVDPTSDENISTFSLLHEIEAHLKNKVNKLSKSEKQEHYEFYNYKENPALLIKYPNLKFGKESPLYDDTPSNSKGGEIKQEVEKVYNSGQSTINSGTNEE